MFYDLAKLTELETAGLPCAVGKEVRRNSDRLLCKRGRNCRFITRNGEARKGNISVTKRNQGKEPLNKSRRHGYLMPGAVANTTSGYSTFGIISYLLYHSINVEVK